MPSKPRRARAAHQVPQPGGGDHRPRPPLPGGRRLCGLRHRFGWPGLLPGLQRPEDVAHRWRLPSGALWPRAALHGAPVGHGHAGERWLHICAALQRWQATVFLQRISLCPKIRAMRGEFHGFSLNFHEMFGKFRVAGCCASAAVRLSSLGQISRLRPHLRGSRSGAAAWRWPEARWQ